MSRSSAQSVATPAGPDLNAIQRLFDRGDYRRAHIQAAKALKVLPGHAALHALAGASARQIGRFDEAERLLRRAVELDGEGSQFARLLGDLLLQRERAEAAAEVLAGRLRHHPEDAEACNGLGLALTATAQFPQALTILSEAVRLAPGNAVFVANLGACFEQAGMVDEARQCLAIACSLAPDEPRYAGMRARLEYFAGEAELALETLATALEPWPRDGRLIDGKAVILSALGRRDEAEAAYRAAIVVEPGNHTAYANFANRFDMGREAGVEAAVRQMLARPGGDAVRMSLLYTLTKIEEDKGDFGAAYRALEEANALRRAQLRYDPERDVRMFAALKREFEGAGDPGGLVTAGEGPIPIFIVGLPRSGTTLVETILERHAEVAALGELNTLMHGVRRGWLAAPEGRKAAALRADYLGTLPVLAQGARFVTDKMPLNFRFIGHVAAAFPEARIVHVTRDARATCWSNYRTFFSSAGNGFSYDPEDILRFRGLYRDLMAFWEERFPGRIVTVDYDALVADQVRRTKDFVAALGLPWDAACLSPEASRRAVLTASTDQVRRKVYGGSSEGWRRYEPYAGAWLNRLEGIQAP